MGWKFRHSRRSIKVLPGIRVNVSPKGISSISVGRRKGWFRLTVNLGKRGIRVTHRIRGIGSFSNYKKYKK
ncbi:MAG: DUF4236 domain-containing protein [Spirulina sp. SIO3F2]|nr:DUF4236 domain-containing protein [Spirulina sp. SIO3F2]